MSDVYLQLVAHSLALAQCIPVWISLLNKPRSGLDLFGTGVMALTVWMCLVSIITCLHAIQNPDPDTIMRAKQVAWWIGVYVVVAYATWRAIWNYQAGSPFSIHQIMAGILKHPAKGAGDGTAKHG